MWLFLDTLGNEIVFEQTFFLLLVRKFQHDKTQRIKIYTHDMKEVAHIYSFIAINLIFNLIKFSSGLTT